MKITYKIQKGIKKEECDDFALIGSKIINDEVGLLDLKNIDRICIGDGVGGNSGGNEASLFIMEYLSKLVLNDSIEDLRVNLIEANTSLLDYAKSIAGHESMATTMTGLFFGNDHVAIAHCGNTRVYVLQGSFLKQITTDQTTYQWLLSTGNEVVAEYCNKSEICGAFGGGCSKFANTLIIDKVFERGIPNKILMTSDGVHDILDIDEIEDIVANNDLDSNEKVSCLISLAVNKGSKDDCTAVLIEGIESDI